MHFQSETVMCEIQVIIHLVEEVEMLSDESRIWISTCLHRVKTVFDIPGIEHFLIDYDDS